MREENPAFFSRKGQKLAWRGVTTLPPQTLKRRSLPPTAAALANQGEYNRVMMVRRLGLEQASDVLGGFGKLRQHAKWRLVVGERTKAQTTKHVSPPPEASYYDEIA